MLKTHSLSLKLVVKFCLKNVLLNIRSLDIDEFLMKEIRLFIYIFPKQRKNKKEKNCQEVPPRFELGSLDSKSRVLTITPWDRCALQLC